MSVILLLALAGSASASEQAHFWGTWQPRPLLREFWRPVSQSWWSCDSRNRCGPDARLRDRCQQFARSHSPETAIPEIIADLFAFQSEATELVYLTIMAHWPHRTVVRALDAQCRSSNPGIRQIADQTRDDFVDATK